MADVADVAVEEPPSPLAASDPVAEADPSSEGWTTTRGAAVTTVTPSPPGELVGVVAAGVVAGAVAVASDAEGRDVGVDVSPGAVALAAAFREWRAILAGTWIFVPVPSESATARPSALAVASAAQTAHRRRIGIRTAVGKCPCPLSPPVTPPRVPIAPIVPSR